MLGRVCTRSCRLLQAGPSRAYHASRVALATSRFDMPAMSPTMTEGGISEWKIKEGDKFSQGDVLLTIETDKASIDVEAQDDGVLGKIVVQNGATGVAVGDCIAVLAEEGDDLSAIEVPAPSSSSAAASEAAPKEEEVKPAKKEEAPAPKISHGHAPKHSAPLLPAVSRLLVLHDVKDPSAIKATGRHGQLSKGDVLAYLGKISSPQGTEKVSDPPVLQEGKRRAAAGYSGSAKAPVKKELATPLELRSFIARGLGAPLAPKTIVAEPPAVNQFDAILADYLPPSKVVPSVPPPAAASRPVTFDSFLSL